MDAPYFTCRLKRRPFPPLCRLGLLALLLTGSISASSERPNVLLICIDDLRPELKCFGAGYIHSPNIDGLAREGRAFTRHYVQAPTCGASRYTLLTGTYGPAHNGALFQRSSKAAKLPPTLPAHFRNNGYTTVSVGKVSHHPGGRGGSDWDDDTKIEMPLSWSRHLLPAGPWKHPRGAMHGLANGEIRGRANEMDVFQATPGADSIYPDGLITDEALRQLDQLAGDGKPFFLATGIIRPHLPFGAPAKYMVPYKNAKLPAIPHPGKPEGKTTWHGSGEFMKYKRWGKDPRNNAEFALEVRKHYAACVTYADAQVGRLLAKLDELKLRENTIIILWGDHGWHLGEHSVWGKHTLFEESLRSPLIVVSPQVKQPGTSTKSIVETIDLYPTLCSLSGLPSPEHLVGASLAPQLADPTAPGHSAISYNDGATTLRTATHRLTAHKDGSFELYNHSTPAGETKNLAAEQPELTAKLHTQLNARRER